MGQTGDDPPRCGAGAEVGRPVSMAGKRRRARRARKRRQRTDPAPGALPSPQPAASGEGARGRGGASMADGAASVADVAVSGVPYPSPSSSSPTSSGATSANAAASGGSAWPFGWREAARGGGTGGGRDGGSGGRRDGGYGGGRHGGGYGNGHGGGRDAQERARDHGHGRDDGRGDGRDAGGDSQDGGRGDGRDAGASGNGQGSRRDAFEFGRDHGGGREGIRDAGSDNPRGGGRATGRGGAGAIDSGGPGRAGEGGGRGPGGDDRRRGAETGDGRRWERAPQGDPAGRPQPGQETPGHPAPTSHARGHHAPGHPSRGGATAGGAGQGSGQPAVHHGAHGQPARPPHGHVGHAAHGPAAHGPLGEARAPRPPRGTSGRAYAALDLGTNNCRLLVAEPLQRGFRVVDAFSRIVRLGEGIGRTGELAAAAMDRAIEALEICRRKLAEHDVARARLIATEACRSAANGALFIERVRREVGLELEIVTRETEARLAVTGCASLVDPDGDGAILFDIGGGSSELVWIDLGDGPRRDPARCIRAWTSLPVGVVTLSERHGGVRVDDRVFEAMVADVSDMLAAFPEAERLDRRLAGGGLHMLGTSGTVTTLAGVFLDLKRYDRRRVDGAWLTDAQVGAMVDRLRGMSYDDRVEHPCIGGDRADLVLAGCAILEAVRRRWPCPRLRVADRGLREGILTQLMRADRVWERPHSRHRHGDGRT